MAQDVTGRSRPSLAEALVARIEDVTGQTLYVDPEAPRARHARPGWTLPGLEAPVERLARRAEPSVLLPRRPVPVPTVLDDAELEEIEVAAEAEIAPEVEAEAAPEPEPEVEWTRWTQGSVAHHEHVVPMAAAVPAPRPEPLPVFTHVSSTASVPVVVESRATASLTPSSTSSHRVARSMPRQRRVVREATPVTDSLREPSRPRRRAIDVERGVARDVVLDLDAVGHPAEPARYEVPQDLARRLIDLSIPAGRGRHRAPEWDEQSV